MAALKIEGAARLRDAGGDPKHCERLGGGLDLEDTAPPAQLQHLRRRWLARRGVGEPMLTVISSIAFIDREAR